MDTQERIANIIAEELNIKLVQVVRTIELINEGNTIPFIARYRKEVTGGLSDETLRDLGERLTYLRNLEARKEEVKTSIENQGKLTDEIVANLENAKTLAEVEDVYRPYKQKKKTRATVAKAKGLEPLANIIFEQKEKNPIEEIAKEYINIEKLSDEEKTLQAKIDEINKQYEEVNQQILELAQQGLDTTYIGGELAWPVPGYTRITSKYAMRVHPITGQYKLHTGVDIGAPMGANFISANDGIVVKAEMNSAYGNMVIIDHGGGISTLYAHGSEILVTVGQSVKRGDAILKVGSTGYSTGPHAHFEVRINGVTTNPLPYITNGLVPGEENTSNQNTTNQNTTN